MMERDGVYQENRNTTKWMKARELAHQLRLHEKTVRKLASHGIIPHIRAGKSLRFDIAAVVAALARGNRD